ncbi:DUF3990 domain-containing protein [Clostridium oryzae]|uniref:DUF3990 domain-containing protein n=1 Tax=Clostridium oryzae TaxID=1450648 RepID=A0A1V4IUS4_9CLOT|nr:DUF3990 domain-containing protein [Clostridium oryzae]OPJ63177.1 hypothetical protein CLORY_12600 [Clostridium oryzae]
MSIQSDIEMLVIQTMEVYAKRNHLLAHDANELFHKHQVFEKIILQHEYLHQISFDEVMEFVEKSLNEESKELILFHGTVSDFKDIKLGKSHNRRDFGIGFYTTLLERQAKEWAYRLSLREKKNTYYVYQFVFEESDTLKIKRFDSLNKEWLEFIKENRSKGGLQHDNDVVIGPVADDNTMETVQLYIASILTADEAVKRLKYNQVNNQVSFHTEKALLNLKFVRRSVYE